jgi:ABC-type transport system substrate-binding protein
MHMSNYEHRTTIASRRFPFVIRPLSFVMLLTLLAGASHSTEPTALIDRPPFDQIVLNEANQNARLDVVPLKLPQRPPRNLPREGKLAVQLLDRPAESFEVDWSGVAEIRVYEQMLLDEARRLTAAGDYDSAYDYFARISNDYPNLPGLDDAVSDYLRRNAYALYQAKQNDRALALLLTLYQRNPRYRGLPDAVETVAGEIITQYLRNQQYEAARAVLDLWRIEFKGVATEAAAKWQSRFESAAERKVAEARQFAEQRQYIEARRAAEGALGIWPDYKPASEVLANIQRDYPFVNVAVFETAPSRPSLRIDDWAALRTSQLTTRKLAEQVDFGSEGGVYVSPFGQWKADDSGLVLTLQLASSSPLKADQLARYILRLVDPTREQFRADLAILLDGVSISDDGELELHWRHPHVRPEALLQFPPPSVSPKQEGGESENSDRADAFMVTEHDPDQTVFTPASPGNVGTSSGLHAIVERRMPNDEAAVSALLAGDVDVLDRVPPWKLDQLRAAHGVQVQNYRLPTVHVLIPNFGRPLPAKREFRRALCFGIDRQWIVDRVLLGGTKRPGFEVVSGPFPTGLSLSDPIRYGNNNQLVARPFEPRLAAILAEVARSSAQTDATEAKEKADAEKDANDKEENAKNDNDMPLTDMPELVLAHPSDPVARLACQTIKLQLEREGIPITLREFTSEELLEGKVDYDLRYAELAVWEPVTDARLIMGPRGLAGAIDSPYLNTALRRLDQADNWRDVRARLADIHQIAHHELPVIPLWQTVNFYAYRTRMDGMSVSPLTLYQNVDDWQMSVGNNVAQVDSSR